MKKKLISALLTVVMLASMLAIPASAAKTLGASTTTSLNLRKSASTSSSLILTMPKAAEVIVLSTSNGWSKVVYNNKMGYASSKYLKADSTVSGKFGTGTISGTDVLFRKGAGTSYSVIGSFDKGAKVSVTGAKNAWYKVSYKGQTGYVYSSYLKISASSTSSSTSSYKGILIGSDVRMRSGAGTSYKILGVYAKDTKMTVLGSKSGWYNVKYDGKTGYVSGDYMQIVPKTSYSSSKLGKTTVDSAKLRMGPLSSFSLVNTLPKGTMLKITGLNGSWYEVSANGKYGFIYKDNLKLITIISPKEKMNTNGVVIGDNVRIRRGPSTNYTIVGYCNNTDRVKITGKTNDWYAITFGDIKGYISADYIKRAPKGSSDSYNSDLASRIIAKAETYLGTPYVYGGAEPGGFDCSGFVHYIYGQFGYSLERGATSQYNTNGYCVSKSELKPADLVFFSDSVDPIGHVGIYIGDGQFIHASSGKGEVTINNLSDYYYAEHYTDAKRIIS